MKRKSKITSVLVITAITMALSVGCSSKKADTATTEVAGNVTNSRTSGAKQTTAEMKTVYSNILKALVIDKTISQVQSDKVLVEVTKARTGNFGNERPSGTEGKDKPTGTEPGDGTKGEAPEGGQGGEAPADGTRPKNDRLSTLVTSKVITQAQADTINEKIQDAMQKN
jgi:hypothetical protein